MAGAQFNAQFRYLGDNFENEWQICDQYLIEKIGPYQQTQLQANQLLPLRWII
jgi:hypothetical protein